MPDLLASKGGSCGWITSPSLGAVKVKSLFVAFGYRSHYFLPCPCRDLGLAGGPVSGSLTVCQVPQWIL